MKNVKILRYKVADACCPGSSVTPEFIDEDISGYLAAQAEQGFELVSIAPSVVHAHFPQYGGNDTEHIWYTIVTERSTVAAKASDAGAVISPEALAKVYVLKDELKSLIERFIQRQKDDGSINSSIIRSLLDMGFGKAELDKLGFAKFTESYFKGMYIPGEETPEEFILVRKKAVSSLVALLLDSLYEKEGIRMCVEPFFMEG